jgi:glyoxylase-like metal-dependent hydrolase (beta-lactamase superfamily II)
MAIHHLNCFTCNARWPKNMKTGLLCLLVETNFGLVLVDTGLGLLDYSHPSWFTQFFRVITSMPFDLKEAAVNQIRRRGYKPEDIRHIVLTHMHFDHCGGLPDFPQAKVHVHRREYEAFVNGSRRFKELAYIKRNITQVFEWGLYDSTGETWFDFDAIRLPGFEPQIWLIPLFGHSYGHCGVAIQTPDGWHFHCGDAGVDIENNIAPDWVIAAALGPHWPRLRVFAQSHPEIRLTASHMYLDFFTQAV